MKKVSFIHAADLHLDSPMVGLGNLPEFILKRLRESTFEALKKITNAAIEKNVDFVIFAGDLFDGEDRSLKAQSFLRKELQKLETKGIPVFIIHGNHDHLSGDWIHLELPNNVYVFTDKVEAKAIQTNAGVVVNLYGFSYPKRHVYERKIAEYQKVGQADFHIGILHGNEEGESDHGNYAPFHIKELLEKDFDYWALGHIHKRKLLSEAPPILYPGNIQGRNKKEKGKKGCYFVTISELQPHLEFLETSDVTWEETVVDLKGIHHFHEVLQKLQDVLNTYRKDQVRMLLSLSLINVELEDEKERKVIEDHLLELLQESEQNEESFVWVHRISADLALNLKKEELKQKSEFCHELLNTIEQYENDYQPLSSLYEHQLGRRYLSRMPEKEQKMLLEKAEKLLLAYLYK